MQLLFPILGVLSCPGTQRWWVCCGISGNYPDGVKGVLELVLPDGNRIL